MDTTHEINQNGITGTATSFLSDPFTNDPSISVIIKLDRAVGGNHRWIFWSDFAQNTVTIKVSVHGEHELIDVDELDGFTGVFDGAVPTADQMVEAAASWLEEQSAFD